MDWTWRETDFVAEQAKSASDTHVSRAFSTHSTTKYAASEGFGENGPFLRRKILKGISPSCDFAPETEPFSLKPRSNP
jgi:hypothetical protein